MKYNNLGRTGVKVSQLCLGTMNFGGRTNEVDALKIMDQALDSGINFVDSANVYGHDPANFNVGRGRAEEIVGKSLASDSKRDRVILATKAYFPMSDDLNAQGSNRRHLIEQCEASLKRLNTDYIDLFQLHHPSNEVPIDESLRALDDLIVSGKVRYIGTSSFAAWQIIESLWASKEYRLNRFICEQPAYNLLDRRIERELIPMAKTYGIAVIPWSPTAGGFLTGQYRRDQSAPAGSRFSSFWQTAHQHHQTEGAYKVVDLIEAIALEKECTSYQIALAWVTQQTGVTCPIVGPRTVEHLTSSLGALDVVLTAEDMARIDRVAPPGRAVVPYYGNDGMTWIPWGPHQQRW